MRTKNIVFLIFFICFIQFPLFSKTSNDCLECDILLKVERFLPIAKLARNAIEYEENYYKADSILKYAISRARSQVQPDSIIIYGIYYLSLPDLIEFDTVFSKNLITELVRHRDDHTNSNLLSILNYFLSAYYFRLNEGILSYNSSTKILQDENAPKCIKILSLIGLAKANEIGHDFKSALKYFFNSVYVAEEMQDAFYKSMVFRELSLFYSRNNLFAKAYEYKSLELKNIANDSLTYYYAFLLQLENIRQSNIEGEFNFADWSNIVNYATRNSYKKLISYSFAFIRTSYLDAGRSKDLFTLYRDMYPHYLEELKQKNLGIYYRMLAAYNEAINNVDSAEYYYQAAFNYYNAHKANYGYYYSINLRYANFLVSIGNYGKAEEHYLLAKAITKKLNILMFQYQIAEKLNELHKLGWKSERQMEFIEQYYQLKSKMDSILYNREIVKMELESNEEISLLKNRLEEEQKELLHQNQYNLIAVFIGLLFFILLAAVQWHVPIWIIRTLGFLFFIFLFEFFIIKLDKQIHHLTHEVPWKLFAIKVILFSMLLPLHHYLEKKVVHYLVEKRASGGRLIKLDLQTVRGWFQKWNRPG